MKIVMIGEAATHQQEVADALPFEAEFVALPREAHESDQWDDQIEGADVLVAMRYQRAGKAPSFRLLQVPGAGLDGINFDKVPAGSTVCNVFEHEIPMGEYALSAMLQHEVRLSTLRSSFDSNNWSESYLGREPRSELYGKTLLVVGFGRIGHAVAQRAKAFGMKIIGINQVVYDDPLADEIHTTDQLLNQLPRAHYVVLSCPMNEETRDSFGAAQLAAMNPDAVLINIARGPIINQQALWDALKGNKIARAYIDVWYRYPAGKGDKVTPADFPFDTLPNAVCTPHVSGWTHGLFARRYRFIAKNIARLQNNEPLQNVVFGESQK